VVILSYIVDFGKINEWALFSRVAVPALTGFLLISVSLLILFFDRRDYKIDIEQQMTLMLGFSAMLILFVSVNSRQRIKMLIDAGQIVEHTTNVNQNLYRLRALVTDNQSGVRGFLLLNEDQFLEPVKISSAEIPILIDMLDSLVSDNQAQISRMKEIRRLAEIRIKYSDDIINLSKTDKDSALLIFRTDIGRKLADSIRLYVRQMSLEGDSLLIRRNEDLLRHSQRSIAVISLNTLVQFLLLAIIFFVITRYIKVRKKKFTEIEQTNLDLGKRVTATSDSVNKVERKFRETLENLMEGCQIIDFSYRYLFVNDTAAVQAKMERKKLEGRLMTGLFPGIESTEMFLSLKRSMTERIVTEMDNQFTYKEGTSAWFRLKMIPVQEGVLIMSSDITFIKKADEELRNSNEKYKYLFDNNPLPMWIYDLQTTQFLEVNEAAVIKYGYPKEEFLRMTLKDIRPREDVSLLLDNIKYTSETIAASGPWRHLKKNGEIIFVEIISHTIQFEGREARLVLSNDVTEKVIALEKIVESERIYKYVFEHNPQPMWIFDTETYAFLQVNQAAIEHYGYSREEFLSMTSKDIRPPEDVATLVSTVSSEKNEISNTGYWRHKKKNGELIYVEVLTHSIIFDNRKARLVLLYDTTKRLKAEEALNRRIQAMEMALKYGGQSK
jgi:PAS domain S-box-containing protein